MTSYELHLLGLAVEEMHSRELDIVILAMGDGSGWVQSHNPSDGSIMYDKSGATLAEALAALLTDMGVDVPERPSADRVQSIAMSLEFVGGDRVKYLRSVDRLALLALLEGGAS